VTVLRKLLPLLLLASATALSAHDVRARFTTNKANYGIGEPINVTLVVTNNGSSPIWVDFKSPDFPLLCHDFAVEIPGASPAGRWGCGIAGSCVRGFREIPAGGNIARRQLLNAEFSFNEDGLYTLHARTAIGVHNQNLFSSPEIDRLEVSDTLKVNLHRSSESQLKAAFQPYVEDLDSPELGESSEAAAAITALAPPFLEDVLIELTKTNYAYAAIEALRKANTLKTREALAQIARNGSDSMLRIEAIRNLGRTNDVTYLPTLVQLMDSDSKEIQNAAAEAAGNLGGSSAVPQLASLISSPNVVTRLAGTNGLGNSHANEAVPLLIGMLVDSDPNIRQAAVSGLWLLTQRAAFDGDKWADVTSVQSAAAVRQRWVRWWSSHGNDSKARGIADCSTPQPLD
jgi:HEAT repeats